MNRIRKIIKQRSKCSIRNFWISIYIRDQSLNIKPISFHTITVEQIFILTGAKWMKFSTKFITFNLGNSLKFKKFTHANCVNIKIQVNCVNTKSQFETQVSKYTTVFTATVSLRIHIIDLEIILLCTQILLIFSKQIGSTKDLYRLNSTENNKISKSLTVSHQILNGE